MKEIPFCYATAGREDTPWKNELHDCTVVALAVATCSRYDEAAIYLRKHGRKWSCGMQEKPFSAALKSWPKNSIKKIAAGGRVKDLIKKISSGGRYIVGIKGHVFAIRGGMIFDTITSKLRAKVTELWKID